MIHFPIKTTKQKQQQVCDPQGLHGKLGKVCLKTDNDDTRQIRQQFKNKDTTESFP